MAPSSFQPQVCRAAVWQRRGCYRVTALLGFLGDFAFENLDVAQFYQDFVKVLRPILLLLCQHAEHKLREFVRDVPVMDLRRIRLFSQMLFQQLREGVGTEGRPAGYKLIDAGAETIDV